MYRHTRTSRCSITLQYIAIIFCKCIAFLPREIRYSIKIIFIGVALLAAGPGYGEPLSCKSEDLVFKVTRNGVPVGYHSVSLCRDGKELFAKAKFEIKVKFFALELYSVEYLSQSHWRNGKLLALHSRTNENGTVSEVTANRLNDCLQITGPNGTEKFQGEIIPTNHWNIAVTESSRVLNTITGDVNSVRMRDLGLESVIAEGHTIKARRWAYTGDLDNEVWYDHDGQWVKMRFQGKDGSTIEHVCQRCLIPDDKITNR